MNLSQLNKLKDGDEVVFNVPFPQFTIGKTYKIHKTDIGAMVCDDTGGRRWYLCGSDTLNSRFAVQE